MHLVLVLIGGRSIIRTNAEYEAHQDNVNRVLCFKEDLNLVAKKQMHLSGFLIRSCL